MTLHFTLSNLKLIIRVIFITFDREGVDSVSFVFVIKDKIVMLHSIIEGKEVLILFL